jgi:PAS domain S-box-containing protein
MGIYMVTGFIIFLVYNMINNPVQVGYPILGFATDLLFSFNSTHSFFSWFLLFLALILGLSVQPIFNSSWFAFSRITSPGSFLFSDNYDLMTGENDANSPASRSQQSRSSSLNSGNKGMIMVADGKIMFINKEFCQITGYSAVDVIGKDFVEFIVPQDILKYAALIRTPQNEAPGIQGIGFTCENGREIEVYIAGNKNSSANPNDICLFYAREKDLSQISQLSVTDWFVDSFNKTNTFFWMWDNKGMIYISPNTRQLVRMPLGILMNRPYFIFKALDKPSRANMLASFALYQVTNQFDEEVKVMDGDEERWFRVKLTPSLDAKGQLIHHVGIAYEITDQKQKSHELELKCEEAVNANLNKTAFLANMSHEIRSPLNGILGFSELLADPDLTTHERERYIDIIKNNGIALLSILTDIIDISKLEAGKMKIQEKEFYPAELIRELQLQFARDPMVTHKGLSLKWMASDEVSDACLISDPFRVRQVLVNLITNALKFTNKGKVEIALERWGDRAVFWVKDTGIGMAEENLPYIFDRYRQVTKPDTPIQNGFGLGLAISKALVELLGGNIWVESEAGHGTVFYFTIPYSTPKQTEMSNVNSNETAFPYDWKGRTILIAEDIDFSFLYIEAVLRRTGARVLWAQNGREAIEMVKVNPGIDVALMDIHMPIMNGYDATREIVKLRPDLPVIAQTAFVLPDDVKACYAAGCAGYLAKPIRREQLLNTLTDYFEKIDQQIATQSGNMPVYRSKIS